LNQWGLHWLTLAQNPIGLPQFAVLALQLLDPRLLNAGRPCPIATITPDLTGPKRIGCPANNPICLQSPSAPQLRPDIHRGVP